jgi:N-carbamoyl-L-amino-acid hydrolase
MHIDKDRLWQMHLDMAHFGALPHGGCGRLALSDADRQARDRFVQWCRDAGCRVTVDRAGNLFARREGTDNAAAPVSCGSHLDTQPHGGRFDGISGVLCGVEVLRTLADERVVTRRPIEVIVWTNEEGVRFSPGLLGSSAFAGRLPIERVLDTRASDDGARFGDELERIGYAPTEEGAHPLDAYFELHIEQGPILEQRGVRLGVVTGVQGIRWLDVAIDGQDAHAGTTPLGARRDALLAAAQIVRDAHALGLQAGEDARVTVGRLNVIPNSPSTIPGKARLLIDFRHPSPRTLDDLEANLRRLAGEAGTATRTTVHAEKTLDVAPVAFDPACVDAVETAAKTRGHSSLRMLSGAAHDAMQVASVAPTAMIFVPCRNGLSHNEAESASADDLAAGCEVLLDVLLQRGAESVARAGPR